MAFATAAAGAAAGESGSTRGAAKATFRDTTGEGGADIQTVVVSNDASGLLRFRIDIPNHPVVTDDLRIRIWLDADADVSSGLGPPGVRGADYFLLLDRWELGLGEVGLFTCSGSTCSGGKVLPTGSRPSLQFSYRGGATFTLDAAELGIERLERLRFSIEAWTGIGFDPVARRYDFTNARPDFAPDGAGRWLGYPSAQGDDFWTYDARTMLVKGFSARPAKPRAGRPFTLRLALVRADTGTALTTGAVSCSTTIGGRTLRPSSRGFAGGSATCAFAVPADARGRRFQSSISVRFAGATIIRSIVGKVA